MFFSATSRCDNSLNTCQCCAVLVTKFQQCFAGGFSAIPATAVMAPSERIKVLLQTAEKGRYKGMIDCGVHVLREGGVRSLFKGTFATLLRDVPGSIAWFVRASRVAMLFGDYYKCLFSHHFLNSCCLVIFHTGNL